jgi:tetratricopeptide (TPR) repeat protein
VRQASLFRIPIVPACFLLLLLASGRQLQSPDLGWHIRAGERILEERAIPTADTFTHTVPGGKWRVNQPLAELLFYGIEEHLGAPWLIALRVVVVFAIFLLVLGTAASAGRSSAIITAGVLLLAVLAGASHMLVRPFLLSIALLAFTGWIAERARRGKPGGMKSLPLLFAVWAHVHPGFLYGAALLFSYCTGEYVRRRIPFFRGDREPLRAKEWRRLLLWSSLALAAGVLSGAALNPGGLGAILLPIGLLKTGYFFTVLNEFQPASIVRDRFFALLLLLAAASVLPRKRRDATEILLLVLFGVFAFRAVRVIFPFAVVASPIAIRNLAPVGARLLSDCSLRGRIVRVGGLVGILYFVVWWWNADPYRLQPIAGRELLGETWPWARVTYPIRAFQFIEEEGLPGEVFHLDRFGGPFIWYFYPERKNFVDGRVEVFGEEFWRDRYRWVLQCGQGWEDLLDRYEINTLLLMMGTRFYADQISKMIPALSGYVLVYFDDYTMIYVRRNSLSEEHLARIELVGIDPVVGPAPASFEVEVRAREGLDRNVLRSRSQRALLYRMELHALRDEWAAVAGAPDWWLAVRGKSAMRHSLCRLRGEARFRLGDREGAREDWESARNDVGAKNDLSLLKYLEERDLDQLAPAGQSRSRELSRLGDLLSSAGSHGEAAEVYREALLVGGGEAAIRAGLARVLVEGGLGHEEVLAEAQQVVREKPTDGSARLVFARALLAQGDREGAEQELRRALSLLPVEAYREAAEVRGRLALLLAEDEERAKRSEGLVHAARALEIDPESELRPGLIRFIEAASAEGLADPGQ